METKTTITENSNQPSESLASSENPSKKHSVFKEVLRDVIFPALIILISFFLYGVYEICDVYQYQYYTVSDGFKLYAKAIDLFILLPAIIIFIKKIIQKCKPPKPKKRKKVLTVFKNIILTVLFILYLLIGFILEIFITAPFSYSETDDMHNYLQLDPICFANRDVNLHKLFPSMPALSAYEPDYYSPWTGHKTADTAHYYYRFIEFIDYTYDVYAEWTLPDDQFEKEVDRVRSEFEDYDIRKWGDYTCLFIDGYKKVPPEDNYYYVIFAYNQTNNTVRYIYANSLENGADQPYFLQLDW